MSGEPEIPEVSDWTTASLSHRKRMHYLARCGPQVAAATKHKVGYNTSWNEDFLWHIPIYDSAGSTVTGLVCSSCKQHHTKQRGNVDREALRSPEQGHKN